MFFVNFCYYYHKKFRTELAMFYLILSIHISTDKQKNTCLYNPQFLKLKYHHLPFIRFTEKTKKHTYQEAKK